MSFLVTFGIILPLTAWAPFHIMNSLDIRSTVLRMGLVPLPICVQLKCLQGASTCGTASLLPSLFSHLVLVSLLWIHARGGHLVAPQL